MTDEFYGTTWPVRMWQRDFFEWLVLLLFIIAEIKTISECASQRNWNHSIDADLFRSFGRMALTSRSIYTPSFPKMVIDSIDRLPAGADDDATNPFQFRATEPLAILNCIHRSKAARKARSRSCSWRFSLVPASLSLSLSLSIALTMCQS